MVALQVCDTTEQRMRQADAWQCMGALQTAICAVCRDGVKKSMARGAAALSEAHLDRRNVKRRREAMHRRSSAVIDRRLLVRFFFSLVVQFFLSILCLALASLQVVLLGSSSVSAPC
jgi:hypothetical protein